MNPALELERPRVRGRSPATHSHDLRRQVRPDQVAAIINASRARPAPARRTGFSKTLLAGAGLLLILPLGVLLASVMPHTDGAPQPTAATTRDSFVARWPAEDVRKPAKSKAQTVGVGKAAPAREQTAKAAAATDSYASGVVGPKPDWKTYATAALQAPQHDTAKFGAADKRQTETRFQAKPMVPDEAPLAQPKTELIAFATAPFPYQGSLPGTDRPFLNVDNGGQKGHRTARGSVLWQEQTFNDSRVLLHIPDGFDINKPAVMVVFFHGHGASLSRDVLNRQKLAEQISLSNMNAVLVAPQFAVNAADSSPGKFWQPGGFSRFIDESGRKLAELYGKPARAKQFATMPVILVAYSGGYMPASWSIRNGGLGKRLRGLVLLDAMYGELNTFARWIKSSPSSFLISSYTSSTRRQNMDFARLLEEEKVPYSTEIGRHLWRGRVAILATDDANHRDFVTRAWTGNPIADILAKLN